MCSSVLVDLLGVASGATPDDLAEQTAQQTLSEQTAEQTLAEQTVGADSWCRHLVQTRGAGPWLLSGIRQVPLIVLRPPSGVAF